MNALHIALPRWLLPTVAAAIGFLPVAPARAGEVVEITRPAVFTAATTHPAGATLKITDTVVRFTAPFTEEGVYVSDPSTSYFTDLTVGPGGYLSGGVGDVFVVSGNFTNNSTQNTLWSTAAAELAFRGGAAPHVFALAGVDLGPVFSGYANNFAWGTLRLAAGQSLTLGDGNGNNAGAALYVTRLILEGGVGQVGNVTGNGASIYYDPTDPVNAPLLAGASGGVYPLAGGGTIQPARAVLKILSIARLANGHFLLTCQGVPNRGHTVQATTDLKNTSFAPLGTVTADANGAFTYEDVNAGSFARRFYRVSFP